MLAAIELRKSIDAITIEYVDISNLPMLNTDLEVDGNYPTEVEAFRQIILQSDCFLFASPEYNYSVTGKSFDYFFMFSICCGLLNSLYSINKLMVKLPNFIHLFKITNMREYGLTVGAEGLPYVGPFNGIKGK